MKERLKNKLLSYLLNSVNPDDVVRQDKGVVYMGKNPIQEQDIRQMQAEIKALEGFRIWRIMNETVRSQAMDLGFNKSVNFDDMRNCKMMLFNLDIFNSIIKVIKNRNVATKDSNA